MELEQKIIDEIIAMLDEQEGEKLKKHPKIMALQVEVEKKPKLELEKPELKEDEEDEEEELSPELLQKILEMTK